jgi:hypothetical protein
MAGGRAPTAPRLPRKSKYRLARLIYFLRSKISLMPRRVPRSSKKNRYNHPLISNKNNLKNYFSHRLHASIITWILINNNTSKK